MGLTLSVLSAAYNSEDCVVGFLESLAAQTYHEFEYIIIDDASTDRTADLIQSYLPRLGVSTIFIRHLENQGQKATVVEALSRAKGDICIYMDADGLLEPDAIAKIMESFAEDEQVGIVATLEASLGRSNWIQRGTEVTLVTLRRADLKDPRDYAYASGRCFAFRRQVFTLQDWVAARTDVDLSWLARKRGWRILLREDITVQTRLPDTLSWTFSRGRRMTHEVLPTYLHHKEKLLTRWGFWVKFAPLGLLLTAPFKPRWALAGLLGWLGATQVFFARKVPDYPLSDRFAAWVVTAVRWSAFDLELILMVARAVRGRLTKGK